MEKQNKQKVPKHIPGHPLLSYLDSNQDKLIQSQMCYRYTIGQSAFVFLSKTGAKVQPFLELTKFFFDRMPFILLKMQDYKCLPVIIFLFFSWNLAV